MQHWEPGVLLGSGVEENEHRHASGSYPQNVTFTTVCVGTLRLPFASRPLAAPVTFFENRTTNLRTTSVSIG